MSKTGIWTLVIAVIVIVGGIWWWAAAHNGANTGANNASSTSMAGEAPTSTASSSLPQGNSDQAINQEMTDINAQMNGLNSDTANVSSSMNDQPVPQSNP